MVNKKNQLTLVECHDSDSLPSPDRCDLCRKKFTLFSCPSCLTVLCYKCGGGRKRDLCFPCLQGFEYAKSKMQKAVTNEITNLKNTADYLNDILEYIEENTPLFQKRN